MFRSTHAVLLVSLGAALAGASAEAAQRTFVASYGSDANVATSCAFSAPCRGFAAAVTVADAGGEVLALDSIGYGSVVIDRSITLTAAPGAYAGISVGAGGTGVTIATAGVNVTLRGLNINNVGGSFGVTMTNGSRLSIENCVISNFSNPGGYGVKVDTPAAVRIVDSTVRDNYYGVVLQNGATATITGSKILGHLDRGIYMIGTPTATTTTAAISDTGTSGNYVGVYMGGVAGATVRASMIRLTSSNNTYGVAVEGGASTVATVGYSLVTANSAVGLYNGGGTNTIRSLANNIVDQNNVANTAGTITVISGL